MMMRMMHGSMRATGGWTSGLDTMREEDEEEARKYRLSALVEAARGLRDGDAKVYARVKLSGYKYSTPKVRRQQTAQAGEAPPPRRS